MKVSLSWLALVPLLSAATWIADGVVFAPAEDSTLTKRFLFEVDVEMDDFTVTVNGQDMSEMIELDDMAGAMSVDATVTDTYEKVDSGRPTSLLRAFDELVFAYESSSNSDEKEGDVAGKEVRFTWNEDDEAYEAEWVAGDGDEEALVALDEDMDLRALLPDGDVDEGDSWEVDPDSVLGVLLPGTNPVSLLSAAEIPDEGQAFATVFAEGFGSIGEDMELVCTYRGTREVDDVEVAVIGVEMEGGLLIDLITALESMELPAGAEVQTAELALQVEGEGELLWNQAAGHMHSFELTADLEMEFDGSVSADLEGNALDAEGQVYFSGEASWSAELP